MKRYTTTLARFWSAAFAAEAEYRVNFTLAALTSVMGTAGALLTLQTLFSTGYQIGGWSWPEALLVMGPYLVLDGTQQTIMSPNRSALSEHVREGTLDFILIKPIDAQFYLSAHRLSLWGIPGLVLGVGLTGYALVQLAQPDSPAPLTASALWLFPLMALGLVTLYSLGYILATVSIWATKLDNLTYAMQALLEAGRFPVSGYPFAYRVFFTAVLPVAFMTTIPAEVALGRAGSGMLLLCVAVAFVMFTAARLFWSFALRSYTSASS
ncbi:MAG: ABC-2 family transporter protein [Planctomycetota bacterium]